MAKKDTVAVQETVDPKASTVVLNGEDTGEEGTTTTPEETPSEKKDEECPHDSKNCTCNWGYCPKESCERYYQNPDDVPTSQEFLYHLDETGAPVKDKKKANPNYKKPEDDKKEDPNPNPDPVDPTPVPDGDCDLSGDEPWAHDILLEDDDEHTGLEKELRLHCGVTYDVVKLWLDDLKEADDKDSVIDKIAWHIPTGGPQSIKVHHKEKIIVALKALK